MIIMVLVLLKTGQILAFSPHFGHSTIDFVMLRVLLCISHLLFRLYSSNLQYNNSPPPGLIVWFLFTHVSKSHRDRE